jgi:3-deoxy-manno-octulosonate cytidylyltransferase (CMP-KDO synthetase)
MPKTAVIIPARWGATRFPGKALHPIAGKPLLQHVWERASRAREIDRVIVATDDLRIAEAAFAFGAEVSLTSAKHRSGTDRIAEVAARLPGVTHLINVQGDEPMIDPALITRLARTMLSEKSLAMVTAADLIDDPAELANPNVVKVVRDGTGDALYFSRSPIPYLREAGHAVPCLRHQGIYGYTRKFLLQFVKWKPSPLERAESLEQLRALENGARIRVLLTKKRSLGVDTPADAITAERLLGTALKAAPFAPRGAPREIARLCLRGRRESSGTRFPFHCNRVIREPSFP